MEFRRPREFRFIQELCPMEPVKLPKFTSAHRDLNSPAQADIHPVAERHLRMDGGRSQGANPGTPSTIHYAHLAIVLFHIRSTAGW
jgi:hypothetical protein